jgi:hypothetical protein
MRVALDLRVERWGAHLAWPPAVWPFAVGQQKGPAVGKRECSHALAIRHVSEPLCTKQPFPQVASVPPEHRQLEVADLGIVAVEQEIQSRVLREVRRPREWLPYRVT